MQWYTAVVDYAINVGGRPLHSWPMFVPVTFELTILGGALAAVLALLFGNGLPNLYHPVFNAPDFDLATRNRFFLCLRVDDPAFDRDAAARLLDALRPLQSLRGAGDERDAVPARRGAARRRGWRSPAASA